MEKQFINAKVVLDDKIIENGVVRIADGLITYVGEENLDGVNNVDC